MSTFNDLPNSHYPVAIVGGSSVGLVSSILLSMQGIPHILFERHPSTAIHPKATGLNQRSMEVFYHIGVADEIAQHAAPNALVANTAWYTSLGSKEQGRWQGREIAKRSASRGPEYAETLANGSFAPWCIIPQIRLDPILKRRAEKLGPGRVWFGYEVMDVEEQNSHVVLTVLKRDSGEVFKVSSTYVVGADGGRSLPQKLGVQWNGEADIADMLTAHIKAPLSKWHPGSNVYITWFVSPELGGSINSGFLYPLGPWPQQNKTEEWVYGFSLFGDEKGKKLDNDDIKSRLRNILKLDQKVIADAEILSISHWLLNARVVDRYRSRLGRIFLVGDAAHKVPPWGSFGLNSGIGDVYNLIWKLALAVKRPEENWEGLFETYDAERRPVAEFVAKTSFENIRSHSGRIDVALGIRPDAPVEANVMELEKFFDINNETEGKEKREHMTEAVKSLDAEFMAYGCHQGWFYPSADVEDEGKETNHDGQVDGNGELKVSEYYPTTIPGHHVPHSWLVDGEGNRRSTMQMVTIDRFVLLAQSTIWTAVESKDIKAILIDGSDHGWTDADEAWAKQRGVGPTGAVLVRPDGIVAYRFHDDAFVRQPDIGGRINALLGKLLHL